MTTAIVMALIVHIHVATGRVHVNPLLYLLGRRVYEATVGEDGLLPRRPSDVSRVDRRPSRACRSAPACSSRSRLGGTGPTDGDGQPQVIEADARPASPKRSACASPARRRRAGRGRQAAPQRQRRRRLPRLLPRRARTGRPRRRRSPTATVPSSTPTPSLPHRRHGEPRRAGGDRRSAHRDRDDAEHPARRARPDDPALRRRRRQRRHRVLFVRRTNPQLTYRRRPQFLAIGARATDAPRRAGVQLLSEVRLRHGRRLGRSCSTSGRSRCCSGRSGWSSRTSRGGSVASPTTCRWTPPTSSQLRDRRRARLPHLAAAARDRAARPPRRRQPRSGRRYAIARRASIPTTVVAGGRLTFDPAQRFSFLHLLNEDLYKGQLTDELFEAQRKARATPQ